MFQTIEATESALPALLFGTASGMIGVIVSLSQQLYKILLKAPNYLARRFPSFCDKGVHFCRCKPTLPA